MIAPRKRILVLGASGLIGHFVATDLARHGHDIVALARRFTPAQSASLPGTTVTASVAALDPGALAGLLAAHRPDLVVNCIGILQDGPSGAARDVHADFIGRLALAIAATGRPILLVHISIPGEAADDRTDFSRTKRAGERAAAEAGIPVVILRPGFVFGPTAYGGSALLRALAALKLDLPAALLRRPFMAVAVEDVAETVAILAESAPHPSTAVTWDLMHPRPTTLGDVLAALRGWIGGPTHRRLTLPDPLLALGASLGDAASRLGWAPPIRSTALAELRRGVSGDPAPWMAATGIAPRSLVSLCRDRPAGVQEAWFARLYLLKPLVIGGLALFWLVSGLIALGPAFAAASTILTSHGIPASLAHATTITTALIDMAIGGAIALRRHCAAGLLAGIVVSIAYMLGAAVLAPDLWLDPLGAMVKTGPAILLMLVALAILPNR